MKKVLTLTIVTMIAICCLPVFLAGCDSSDPAQENERGLDIDNMQAQAHQIAQNLTYFKDGRTGLCFAYFWQGDFRGGPALACVPCDSVPLAMLKMTYLQETGIR